jgi:hypothetical protein
MKYSVAVMIQIDTNDERLNPHNISARTVADAAQLRRAVMDNLDDLSRVIVVMTIGTAEIITRAHAALMQERGGRVEYPPKAYVPPTRD